LLSGWLNSNDARRGAPGSFAVEPRDAALDESEAIPDRGKISLRLVELLRYQLPFGHAPVMPEDGCLIVKTEAVSDWTGSSNVDTGPAQSRWAAFYSSGIPAVRSPAKYVASNNARTFGTPIPRTFKRVMLE
jgi:hypothetical protein